MTLHNRNHDDPLKLQRFFETAPAQLAAIRRLFAEISRASNEAAREEILISLVGQVQTFKFNSALPELCPVSQLAGILEQLLRQISETPSLLSYSILRTTAAAVVLLESMLVPGLQRDLATKPPVKVLAVDDDPISLMAVSAALRKAFKDTDLAYEGQSGLMLASMTAYEVIFLDVEMPGMDGYEVCARIHETDINRTTPIVFVTSHRDFESRLKSIPGGGQDLIGKPFLSFELALKGLTLVLRNRLHAQNAAVQTEQFRRIPSISVAGDRIPNLSPTTVEPGTSASTRVAEPIASAVQLQTEPNPNDSSRRTLVPPQVERPANAFITTARALISGAQERLQDASNEREPAAQKKSLQKLLTDLTGLESGLERADLRLSAWVCSELKALCEELFRDPRLSVPSTQNAGFAALNLLEEFCTTGTAADLLSPEPRILLVDDDPVVLATLSSAVETVFARPETANSGQAAVTLAGETRFDLIFLDIEMPGMDGYATCQHLHATELNARTPVVFITSHSDTESIGRAALSGCSGFVPKPVLPAELRLRALTFVLRARWEQFRGEQMADIS